MKKSKVGLVQWLNTHQCGLWPVSLKSWNFLGAFWVTQFSLCLQNQGISRHETMVVLIFIPFTAYQRTSFTEQAGQSYTNGFSGPKSFRDFRGTGPSACNSWLNIRHGFKQDLGILLWTMSLLNQTTAETETSQSSNNSGNRDVSIVFSSHLVVVHKPGRQCCTTGQQLCSYTAIIHITITWSQPVKVQL